MTTVWNIQPQLIGIWYRSTIYENKNKLSVGVRCFKISAVDWLAQSTMDACFVIFYKLPERTVWCFWILER